MLGILCHTGGSLQEGLSALRINRVKEDSGNANMREAIRKKSKAIGMSIE